ncbi:hypothetical protein R1flu_016280 [Riccia fluitans]|uniref:Uncharacterized protein n=1 Tax=Riccia fluitans TaxID=41844 RepID=A0ABD1YLF9_9MARC
MVFISFEVSTTVCRCFRVCPQCNEDPEEKQNPSIEDDFNEEQQTIHPEAHGRRPNEDQHRRNAYGNHSEKNKREAKGPASCQQQFPAEINIGANENEEAIHLQRAKDQKPERPMKKTYSEAIDTEYNDNTTDPRTELEDHYNEWKRAQRNEPPCSATWQQTVCSRPVPSDRRLHFDIQHDWGTRSMGIIDTI